MKSPPTARSSTPTPPPSWRARERVAPGVEALCSPQSSSWPREPCGTSSASAAANVTVPWTLCWLVTDLTRRSTVELATARTMDLKDLDTDTPPLWCLLTESPPFTIRKWHPPQEQRAEMEMDAHDVAMLSTPLNR
uniref:Uncharacterized protein n=1 Tax=Cacopsylla melanoneura TaxID=428564 RepID=A0A8D8WAB3_9HEMI